MQVTIAETSVAVFNVDGSIYAINDACLHQGQSLAAGTLDDRVVTCRAHGWRYDVTNGRLTTVPEGGVASYPVQVVDGKILIAVE